MRLISYLDGGAQRFGVLEGAEVTEIRDAESVAGVAEAIGSLASRLGSQHAADALSLMAPVAPLRRNIFCVGWNYPAHFEEGKSIRGVGSQQEIPERPAFFTKATGTLIGPNDRSALTAR